MAEHKAYICGMGAITPLGLDARQTAASVRAGLSRRMESIIYSKHHEPLVLSLVPDEAFPEPAKADEAKTGFTSKQRRLLRLAGPAMTQALVAIKEAGPIPLLLGCAEPLPGKPPVLDNAFLPVLAQQTGLSLDLSNSEIIPLGRASGLVALEKAISSIDKGTPYVLVGGVDTCLDLCLLGLLDSQDRILGERVMDGFTPGEGAGFVLIGRTPLDGNSPMHILAAAQGFEEGHLYSEEPYRGDGLSNALLALFKIIPDCPKIKTVFAGLNGENFGAKEWGVASIRIADRFETELQVEHPVDCIGDPGAALGPLLMILAAVGLQKAHLNGPCLAWCSSDYGTRAAAVIDKD